MRPNIDILPLEIAESGQILSFSSKTANVSEN
jgi:hypothetical protein